MGKECSTYKENEATRSLWLNYALCAAVYLTVNILFVCKYVPRAGVSPLWASVAYAVGFLAFAALVYSLKKYLFSDKVCKYLAWGTPVAVTLCTVVALWKIDPMQINVDRWSATTCFLDALFNGIYPYGVHTHLFEGNYPSPFPVWHYLTIPFWLIGDVGWGMIAFLWLAAVAVYKFHNSHRELLLFLLLLAVSPAFWWEIMVRSDGLSNAFFVFALILWTEKRCWTDSESLGRHWAVVAVIVGLAVCTRFSAAIPLAIFLFRRYTRSDVKTLILFPLIVFAVALAVFAPYIFWDTETWVFFRRNPFMSQSSPGNPFILLVMAGIAVVLACRRQTFICRMGTVGVFFFAFMMVSMLGIILNAEEKITLFDIQCDISYLTLALPYCLMPLITSPFPFSTRTSVTASRLSEQRL